MSLRPAAYGLASYSLQLTAASWPYDLAHALGFLLLGRWVVGWV